MNQSSPVTTGAAAVSGAMIGGVIVWACGTLKIAAPPADVAGTMGALVIAGLHVVCNAIANRPSKGEQSSAAPATPAAPTQQ